MTDDLDTLYQRSEAGIRWLSAHDDGGAFHLWYTARISPVVKLPSVSDERLAAYAEYHHARELWERIESRIKTVEQREAATAT
jgi:hypothetical protein